MFKLNIECTRDVAELHINFVDGTSTVVDNDFSKTSSIETDTNSPKESRNELSQSYGRLSKNSRSEELDLDAEFGGISQEVIKPPEIQRDDRPVNVADELQNFDF